MSKVYGPYSPIRKAGSMYFVSGQVGANMETKFTAKGIEAQTKQVLDNMKAVLAEEGLVLSDVIKTTVFLSDMGNFAAMNAVYETYFNTPRPARSTVAVRELPRLSDIELLVEIEAVAYREML
jgi:2-iminobutanoate/2-iminopropanoate deaminase